MQSYTEKMGQQDKLKILPRDRTGRAGTACQNPGRDVDGTRFKKLYRPVLSRGTKWDRAEKDVLKQEKDVLKGSG